MKLNSKVYDILKWVAMVFLPAVSAMYFGIAGIWNLPYTEQVIGTIAAINTFLGVILGISSVGYYKDEADKADNNENKY